MFVHSSSSFLAQVIIIVIIMIIIHISKHVDRLTVPCPSMHIKGARPGVYADKHQKLISIQ